MKRGRKNRSNACKQGEQVGRVDKKCGISGGGKKAGKCKNICTPGRSPSLLPSCSHSPLILFGIVGIEHILGSIPTSCRRKTRPISRDFRRGLSRQALVAGAWTERKKIFHGGSFLKLADDNMDIQNPEAQNRELSGF